MDVLEIIKIILEILAFFSATVYFVFLSWRLTPSLKLRIIPKWIDDNRVILRIEIENTSKIRTRKEYACLQILEYPNKLKNLSEWVPFSRGEIRIGEEPLEWNEPVDIFKSTIHFFPTEILATERLFGLKHKSSFLHVALQFRSKSSLPWILLKIFGHSEQWTSTYIIKRIDEKN